MSTRLLPQELTLSERTAFVGLLSKIPQYLRSYVDNEGTPTTIRTVKIEDIPWVVKLAYDMWSKEPQNKDLNLSKVKGGMIVSLEIDNSIMLVAERNGKIVAFILGFDLPKDKYPPLANYLSTGIHTHVNYVAEMGVEPGSRRLGIAGELLDSYTELAKAKGVDDIILDTRNPAAMKLYKEKKHYTPVIDPVSGQEVFDKVEWAIYQFLHLEI